MTAAKTKPKKPAHPLAALANVGPATLGDFDRLGIRTVAELAQQTADELYVRLSELTGSAQDPCVHDVFAATIHEAKTGQAEKWWAFTTTRKLRQQHGNFPKLGVK